MCVRVCLLYSMPITYLGQLASRTFFCLPRFLWILEVSKVYICMRTPPSLLNKHFLPKRDSLDRLPRQAESKRNQSVKKEDREKKRLFLFVFIFLLWKYLMCIFLYRWSRWWSSSLSSCWWYYTGDCIHYNHLPRYTAIVLMLQPFVPKSTNKHGKIIYHLALPSIRFHLLS